MASFRLVIGNKRYSSWSLRPWLALKHLGQPFEETLISLYEDGYKAKLLAQSPSGKVPCLIHGERTIWDSLAICEYLAEQFPTAGLWPTDATARALARSACAEMHSGFTALREQLPMNSVRRITKSDFTAAVRSDVARIVEIWRICRDRFGQGGPFLFGTFSNADAFFAPVAIRFTAYGVELPPHARTYVETLTATPAMREWCEAAASEPFRQEAYEGVI